jgi:cytochrome c2
MSVYTLKSILAVLLIASGLCAALAMLVSMGRAEKKASPATLRKVHRAAGYLFSLLLLVLSILGLGIFADSGDALSTRAVLHAVLALFLLFVFLLKIGLVRYFKLFLRHVPALGMAVLVLGLVVFSVSAGYFLLQAALTGSPPSPASAAPRLQGSIDLGRESFGRHCASCHNADSEESKLGPGLKGMFQKDRLPASGRPVTEENLRQQLAAPYRSMPAFGHLPEREVADLIAYLKSL